MRQRLDLLLSALLCSGLPMITVGMPHALSWACSMLNIRTSNQCKSNFAVINIADNDIEDSLVKSLIIKEHAIRAYASLSSGNLLIMQKLSDG